MKKRYYVSTVAEKNGDHEVHTEYCFWLPKPDHRIDLKDLDDCYDAVLAAKKYFKQVNGCRSCCKPCHVE